MPLAMLERDGRALVVVAGRDVAVFRVGSSVYAVGNECPHEGNPLIEGDVVGDTLVCAFHNWRFDLATGSCVSGDGPASAYRVEIDGDVAWVSAPAGGDEDPGANGRA